MKKLTFNVRTQGSQNGVPPITLKDIAKLRTESQFIPFIVSITLRAEQSPMGLPLLNPAEAKNLVEILDNVVSCPTANRGLKIRCLKVLRKVSSTHGVLPESRFPPRVTLSGAIPHASGGFADVWKGNQEGNQVCIKAFRTKAAANPDKIRRRFYREVVRWKYISHPNVLPFLGVSETLFPFCIITPWLPNGNITEYVQKHPEANRLSLLAQTARGLEYLHLEGIVHSNINPGNILITDKDSACLGDFGITAIIIDRAVVELQSMTTSKPGVVRYMAPELLNPSQFGFTQSDPSCESDIYSFAMTAYEVLSGVLPYGMGRESVTAFNITRGDRPPRPNGPAAKRWLPDPIWDVVQRCWVQLPRSRLTVDLLRQAFDESGWERKGKTPIAENDTATTRINDVAAFSPVLSPLEGKKPARIAQPPTEPPSEHPKFPVQPSRIKRISFKKLWQRSNIGEPGQAPSASGEDSGGTMMG